MNKEVKRLREENLKRDVETKNDTNNKSLFVNWGKLQDGMKGGVETFFYDAAQLLKAEVISSFDAQKTLFRGEVAADYKHAAIDRSVIIGEYVNQLLELKKPDFIIRNSAVGAFHNWKCPVITIFQDPFLWTYKEFQKCVIESTSRKEEFEITLPLMQKRTAESSDVIVSVSDFMTKYCEEELCIEVDYTIPLFFDNYTFVENKELDLQLDNKKEFKARALWIGKFHPLKYTFIRDLVLKHKDVLWVLVFAEGLIEYFPRLPNVIIAGNVERGDMAKFYNSVDFTISTSPVESFNLSALECAGCGKPFITYKTGVFWNDTTAEKAGVIVDNYSFESFDAAVDRMKKEHANFKECRAWALQYGAARWLKSMNEAIALAKEKNLNRSYLNGLK